MAAADTALCENIQTRFRFRSCCLRHSRFGLLLELLLLFGRRCCEPFWFSVSRCTAEWSSPVQPPWHSPKAGATSFWPLSFIRPFTLVWALACWLNGSMWEKSYWGLI